MCYNIYRKGATDRRFAPNLTVTYLRRRPLLLEQWRSFFIIKAFYKHYDCNDYRTKSKKLCVCNHQHTSFRHQTDGERGKPPTVFGNTLFNIIYALAFLSRLLNVLTLAHFFAFRGVFCRPAFLCTTGLAPAHPRWRHYRRLYSLLGLLRLSWQAYAIRAIQLCFLFSARKRNG